MTIKREDIEAGKIDLQVSLPAGSCHPCIRGMCSRWSSSSRWGSASINLPRI